MENLVWLPMRTMREPSMTCLRKALLHLSGTAYITTGEQTQKQTQRTPRSRQNHCYPSKLVQKTCKRKLPEHKSGEAVHIYTLGESQCGVELQQGNNVNCYSKKAMPLISLAKAGSNRFKYIIIWTRLSTEFFVINDVCQPAVLRSMLPHLPSHRKVHAPNEGIIRASS